MFYASCDESVLNTAHKSTGFLLASRQRVRWDYDGDNDELDHDDVFFDAYPSKDFSARHEAKSDLEAYIHQVEATITSPEIGMKLKRGAKGQVEAELARALEKLEIKDSTSDELRKAQLGIKRAFAEGDCGHSLGC
jgi:hypothetical protein